MYWVETIYSQPLSIWKAKGSFHERHRAPKSQFPPEILFYSIIRTGSNWRFRRKPRLGVLWRLWNTTQDLSCHWFNNNNNNNNNNKIKNYNIFNKCFKAVVADWKVQDRMPVKQCWKYVYICRRCEQQNGFGTAVSCRFLLFGF